MRVKDLKNMLDDFSDTDTVLLKSRNGTFSKIKEVELVDAKIVKGPIFDYYVEDVDRSKVSDTVLIS